MVLDANATIGKCDGQDSCYRAVTMSAARVGVTFGAVYGLKKLFARRRPCSYGPDVHGYNYAESCGIDNPDYSFPSGHTAFAFSTIGGPRLAFALPLAVGTGGLRVAANKHWLTDTLAGAGIGLLTSRIR
jgi:membrane-associated phospholipid phosphatase